MLLLVQDNFEIHALFFKIDLFCTLFEGHPGTWISKCFPLKEAFNFISMNFWNIFLPLEDKLGERVCRLSI